MDPMAVDMLGCLDGDQCSDKTQLADAVGAEALFLPVIGRAICGGCVPDVSDVTQCVRCSLTAERLFGGFGVRILGKLIFRWLDSTLKIITCIAEAWSVETIDKLFGRSIYLSGFDPKRTLICQRLVYFCLYEVICFNTSLRLFGY